MVVVDVPFLVHAADDGMKMRYSAVGFLMQPYGGLADANLMPLILDAVHAYATEGEICGVLREVFGEYQENVVL